MNSTCLELEPKLIEINSDPFIDGENKSIATTIVSEPKLTPVDFDPFVDGEILLAAPITESQLEIWLAAQMSNEANLGSMLSQSFRLKGLLNIDLLHTAFKQIVSRHESLRTTFSLDGKNILIAQEIEFTLPIIDLSNSNDLEQEIENCQNRAISEPFGLKSGPLFRVKILKLERQEHIIILTVHHIICDGWSYGMIISDLAKIYTALNRGIEPSLEPVEYFSEYAFLEQKKIGTSAAIEVNRYWTNKFATIPPVVELPLDYPRPPVRTFVTACERYSLESNLVDRIKQLGIETGSSLTTTLLAAFEVFLFKITGATELVVGVPTSGQAATGKYNLVGHCVNFLPLRSTIDPEQNFGEYLKFRTSEILDDYEHQDFTFGSLLQKLAIPREASRTPLISAVFNVDLDPKLDRSIFDGLELDTLTSRSYYGTFEFFFNAALTPDGGLNLDCQYNTNLFSAAMIRRRLAEFVNLLTNIVRDLNLPVRSLSLLSDADKHQLLVEWNNTHLDYDPDRCVHQLFENQVKRTPDAIAVIFEQQELTYQQLNDRANRLADYLQTVGVKPDVLVGICVERSLEMVVGLLGILKAGGAYVPLDPHYPIDRLEYMLENGQIELLLTQQTLIKSLPLHAQRTICLDTDWEQIEMVGASHSRLEILASDDRIAYVIYTSGSTGKPKGVAIKHRAVVNFLTSMQQQPGIAPTDTLLSVTTLSFDIAVLEIFLPMSVGARLVLVSRDTSMDGRKLAAAIEQMGITMMQATPATWKLLLAAGWKGHPQLKILSGGESISKDLAAELLARSASVWNLYGPTETTIWSTIYQITGEERSIPIGKPIANTQVYILDAQMQPCPIGVAGEFYIGGDGLARGYLNRPELTQAKFIPNPFGAEKSSRLYKTGDLARYLNDGNIEFLGRIDNQVKIRGFRIELGEIESVLSSHPQIQQAVAIAADTPEGDKYLAAYVVEHDSSNLTNRDLREFVKTKLPDYMIPATFVMLETLPLTPNGKVDRRALPPPEYSKQASRDTFVAPRNDIELELTKIWERVLGIQPIGILDNFFELGGHSLMAVRLFTEIEKTFGQSILLSTLFKAQTIEDIAAILTPKESAPTTWTSLVEIRSSNSPRTPLFCIHALWGNILFYREFIEYLEIDRKVYGLQSRGLDGKHQPCRSIPEMAANYIQEIQSVQPHGPYLLVGFSLGSLIAFEIAQQLQSQGQEIKLLALVDPTTPNLANPDLDIIPNPEKSMLAKIAIHWQILGNLSFQDKITYIREKLEWNLTVGKANIFYKTYLRYIKRSPSELRLIEIVLANNLSLTTYIPQHPYNGKISLFTAEEPGIGSQDDDPNSRWKLLTTEGLDIESVSGSHLNIMKEPNLGILCAKFNRVLNQLDE